MLEKLRRFYTFSEWVWTGFGILFLVLVALLAAYLLKVPGRILLPFTGTFFGTSLGFINALVLEARKEQRTRETRKAEDADEVKRALELVRMELEVNNHLASEMLNYLKVTPKLSDIDFQGRSEDNLFFRFQTSSNEGVHKRLVVGIQDVRLLADLDLLYMSFINANNLLDQICRHIANSLSSGSLAADYKLALLSNPWSNQLPTVLKKIMAECSAVENSLFQLTKILSGSSSEEKIVRKMQKNEVEKKSSFWRQLTLWIILIQFAAAFFAAAHRFSFTDGWENIYPKWKRINAAITKLMPNRELKEQFVGQDNAGFNDLLDVIDKDFVELPNRKAIRGITNRKDEFTKPSGEKIIATIGVWLDFGDAQYLQVTSRNVFLEKINNRRAKEFFKVSFWLLVLSLFMRLGEYFWRPTGSTEGASLKRKQTSSPSES